MKSQRVVQYHDAIEGATALLSVYRDLVRRFGEARVFVGPPFHPEGQADIFFYICGERYDVDGKSTEDSAWLDRYQYEHREQLGLCELWLMSEADEHAGPGWTTIGTNDDAS